MSISTIRTIFCDQNMAPDCAYWSFEGPENGATLRRRAYEAGWAVNRPGGEDICPRCVAFIHAGVAVPDSTPL